MDLSNVLPFALPLAEFQLAKAQFEPPNPSRDQLQRACRFLLAPLANGRSAASIGKISRTSMFGNKTNRMARRRFKDFVRWLGELSIERREFLMALCYRESQVRDLVSYFASLSAEQQFDSLLRLGLTTEQAEQAMAKSEQSGLDRRINESLPDDAESYKLHSSERATLDAPPELLEPPRQLKKRIEMNPTVDLG